MGGSEKFLRIQEPHAKVGFLERMGQWMQSILFTELWAARRTPSLGPEPWGPAPRPGSLVQTEPTSWACAWPV